MCLRLRPNIWNHVTRRHQSRCCNFLFNDELKECQEEKWRYFPRWLPLCVLSFITFALRLPPAGPCDASDQRPGSVFSVTAESLVRAGLSCLCWTEECEDYQAQGFVCEWIQLQQTSCRGDHLTRNPPDRPPMSTTPPALITYAQTPLGTAVLHLFTESTLLNEALVANLSRMALPEGRVGLRSNPGAGPVPVPGRQRLMHCRCFWETTRKNLGTCKSPRTSGREESL
ncbi:hypothetical protein WMY93_002916 [Mugilogobius chulae]|uniref:Uncharacterized protein n=1 Tax=Mugilogobius chulae TaxID=88201 RepID=A0AAW0Q3H1_9GOBI